MKKGATPLDVGRRREAGFITQLRRRLMPAQIDQPRTRAGQRNCLSLCEFFEPAINKLEGKTSAGPWSSTSETIG
jgi:hypothetical protein